MVPKRHKCSGTYSSATFALIYYQCGRKEVSMLVVTKLPNIPKLPEVVERGDLYQLHSPKILGFWFRSHL
jgi:hypothetical protein